MGPHFVVGYEVMFLLFTFKLQCEDLALFAIINIVTLRSIWLCFHNALGCNFYTKWATQVIRKLVILLVDNSGL
jgi:hypothetical protein